MKYIVKETQNAQSDREGTIIDAATLQQAKNLATRSQFYDGTHLRLETESGIVLATKAPGESWQECF